MRFTILITLLLTLIPAVSFAAEGDTTRPTLEALKQARAQRAVVNQALTQFMARLDTPVRPTVKPRLKLDPRIKQIGKTPSVRGTTPRAKTTPRTLEGV